MSSIPDGPSERSQAGVRHRVRLVVAATGITLLLVGLIARLFFIQVLAHEKYAKSAQRMRSSSESVPGYRGDIVTSDKVFMSRGVVDFEVGMDPGFLKIESVKAVVRLVCDAMEKSPAERRDRLRAALKCKEAGGEYVRLVTEVPEAMVKELDEALDRLLLPEERKGMIVEPRPRRSYPRATLASHVVGVMDADGHGIEGIEKSLGSYLSQQDGFREVLKDARQRTRIFKVGNLDVAPVGGYNVHLTLQSTLQAMVEEELKAGILREKAEGGVFILMDVNTGDVLALASYPWFDPNRFGDYPAKEREQRRANKAIENLYEPGSVVKPFIAALCLEKGLMRRDQLMTAVAGPLVTWDGSERARIGRRTITDVHEHAGMTFEGALVHSSNIALSIMGLKLGREGIMDVVDRFGFDRPTGIKLPAEAYKVPWAPPMKWHPTYSPVSAAFGYEIMLSPIQLCRAFVALINGGYLLEPRIVDRVERDGEVHKLPARRVERQAISADTSRQMREILRLVVEEGTARWLRIEGFEFGGKTGTSILLKQAGYTKEDYLASFEAFAPFHNPQVAAICMVEKPRGASIYGGMVAGPIVAEVFRRIFKVQNETKLAQIRKVARN